MMKKAINSAFTALERCTAMELGPKDENFFDCKNQGE